MAPSELRSQAPSGRWPANVILNPEAAALLDQQTGDSGGASRFFYVAKAGTAERSTGLSKRNGHPTVKPLALMQWLVRLVTPPDGLVLDPFAGSGTTGCACVREGFRFVGIERDEEHAATARQRIAWHQAQVAAAAIAEVQLDLLP